MDFNKFSEKSVPNFYSELSTVNLRTDDCSNILDFPGVRGLKFAGAAGVGDEGKGEGGEHIDRGERRTTWRIDHPEKHISTTRIATVNQVDEG